jgi:hypothetical protein
MSTSTPRTPWNQEEHPGAKKNTREALIDLYKLIFLVWGLIGNVIYS